MPDSTRKSKMKIADLDAPTRKVIAIAHMVGVEPTPDRMNRLRNALKEFDTAHEAERNQNLLKAIFPRMVRKSLPSWEDDQAAREMRADMLGENGNG